MAEDWQGAVAAHRARYRDRILDTAVELVREGGVAGLSMARLAQHAGIGRATLYKYFPDLEHVVVAQAERDIDRWAEQLDRALAQHEDPAARLHTYIATLYGYFAGADARAAASLDAGGLSPAIAETLRVHMGKIVDPLIAILLDGVESGAFRADLDPQRCAWAISSLLGAFRHDLITGRMTAEHAVDTIWALLTRGVLG